MEGGGKGLKERRRLGWGGDVEGFLPRKKI